MSGEKIMLSIPQIQITHGKKKSRGELRLPQLHFIASDDWIEKLGERAFCAWLRLYSWADRSDTEREYDAVPRSMKAIQKKLGVAPATFYNTIIRPLWNYGFIDLIEYEGSGTATTTNIIVYEYPCNEVERLMKPLEQIRNYDTDYQSKGKERTNLAIEKACSKIEQAKSERASSKIEQGGQKACSIFEDNNVLNNYFNDLNKQQQQNQTPKYKNEPPALGRKKESAVAVDIDPVLEQIKQVKQMIQETLEVKVNANEIQKWIKQYGIDYITKKVEETKTIGLLNGYEKNALATLRWVIKENIENEIAAAAVSNNSNTQQGSFSRPNIVNSKYDVFYQMYEQGNTSNK